MACCPSTSHDQGYATPAALVFCLALSLVASALVGRSVMSLRLAKSDLERAKIAYALDGAHLAAAAAVVRAGDGGPYRWAFSTEAGWVQALAEPEAEKLGLETASKLSDDALKAFGVSDQAALRGRLDAAAMAEVPPDIGDLDEAALWRACAPRAVSPWGKKSKLSSVVASEPGQAVDPAWRTAEVWRIRLTTQAGWRDDRIVRFTGDAHHPAAVVRRKLSRSDRGDDTCDAILAALA